MGELTVSKKVSTVMGFWQKSGQTSGGLLSLLWLSPPLTRSFSHTGIIIEFFFLEKKRKELYGDTVYGKEIISSVRKKKEYLASIRQLLYALLLLLFEKRKKEFLNVTPIMHTNVGGKSEEIFQKE